MKLLILFAAILTLSTRSSVAAERDPKPAAATPAAPNGFALNLYQRVAAGEGNVLFSPASVAVALAMTDLGAAGETRKQMDAVLASGADLDAGKLHDVYGTLHRRLNEPADAGVQLKMANRLWVQQGYPLLHSFLGDAKRFYDAAPENVDFAGDADASRQSINQWVERQTADKIKDLIKPGVLAPDTRVVLTNAIYFKGDWTDKFEKSATRDVPFHLSADKKVDVPTMRRTGDYRYGEDDAAQWLELPYAKGGVAMVVVLPRKADGLAAVTRSLDAKQLDEKLRGMAKREGVWVWLPRFKMTAAFELAQVLSAMGMPLAFDDRADFSAMTTRESVKISKVIHQAYVNVNEEGTEAAAATAVTIRPTAARVAPPPTEFRADRPFAFLIRDTKSGSILFAGRVANPKE